jgi:hypothetical protein
MDVAELPIHKLRIPVPKYQFYYHKAYLLQLMGLNRKARQPQSMPFIMYSKAFLLLQMNQA